MPGTQGAPPLIIFPITTPQNNFVIDSAQRFELISGPAGLLLPVKCEWNFGCAFDFGKRHQRLHVLYAGLLHDRVEHEFLIPVHIGRQYFQDHVHFAKQGVTLLNLGHFLDCPEKLLPLCIRQCPHLDLREDLHVQSELVPVDDGYDAFYIAFFLQALDPSPARRLRQTGTLGNFRGRQRAILLHELQNTKIDLINFSFHNLSLITINTA